MALVTNRLEQHTDITTPAHATFKVAGLCAHLKERGKKKKATTFAGIGSIE